MAWRAFRRAALALVLCAAAQNVGAANLQSLYEELARTDVELTRLGQLLADAGTPGNPDWLVEQAAACGLDPTRRLDRETRWRAAPCMVEALRRRLQPVADGTVLQPRLPGTPAYFIHPLCLHELAGAAPTTASLRACNAGYTHIPVNREKGAWRAPVPLNDVEATTFGARWLGRGPGGQQVFLIDEGYYSLKIDGTSVVSASIADDTLTVRRVVSGGYAEQCQGAISGASVIAGRGIAVDLKDTGWSRRDGLAEGDLPELFEDFLEPCSLAYRVLYPFDGGPPSLLRITIEESLASVPGRPINDCVAALVRALPGAGVHTLSPQAWRRFVRRLESCKKPHQSSCSTSALR